MILYYCQTALFRTYPIQNYAGNYWKKANAWMLIRMNGLHIYPKMFDEINHR